MKKFLAALLACSMLLAVTACSGDNTSTSDSGAASDPAVSTDAADTSSPDVTDDGSTELLSNPIAVDENGNVDKEVALSYQTDIDALIASFNAKEIDPSKPVSENLNEDGQKVFNYLRSIYGKNVMAAQQMMNTECYEDIVYYNATNDLPAMKGYDFIFNTGVYRDDHMITEAIEWHEETGGLVTFTWHWNVPRDIDDPDMGSAFYQEEIINWSQINAVTPGTKEYEQVICDIDTIAIELQRLESAGVTVLFRPLHEASGAWFWWGIQDRSSAQNEVFQKLWYTIYDRLENYHKLTNIIWVWNGQSQHCYIHPNSYDIAGIDYYANEENHTACRSQYEHLASLNNYNYEKAGIEGYDTLADGYNGKMLAMSECGYIPDPADCVATNTMWLYYMIWNGDFVYKASGGGTAITDLSGTPSPNPERMTNEMLVEYFGNEAMITYRDLPAEYREGKDIPQAIKNWEYFKIS